MASVCTGALLLARSGILDGRRATTNPGALDDLRAHGTIDVIDARVVDDGDILTAGAPVCGIDLASALGEKLSLAGLKYPVEKVYVRSDKYTAYREDDGGP